MAFGPIPLDLGRAMNALIGAQRLSAVTPHATNELANGVCDALWIGVAGDVAVIAENDTVAVTITNVPVGVLNVRTKRVLAVGTTATGIIAMN
jgi:hypothetical protein